MAVMCVFVSTAAESTNYQIGLNPESNSRNDLVVWIDVIPDNSFDDFAYKAIAYIGVH